MAATKGDNNVDIPDMNPLVFSKRKTKARSWEMRRAGDDFHPCLVNSNSISTLFFVKCEI